MMGRHLALVACAAFLALAPGGSDAAQTYKVKKGDNLNRIAKTLRVDVDDLKEANGLTSDHLKLGTKLKVPAHSAKKSEEKKGPKAEVKAAAKAGGKAKAESKEAPPKAERGVAKGDDGAPEETEKPRSGVSHVVKKGDTLKAIAQAFDVPVKDLQRLNGLGKKGKLKPGTMLVVKTGERGHKETVRTTQKTYVVQKGDNVMRIAKKFQLSAPELRRLNGMTSDRLKVGRKLVVVEKSVAQLDDDGKDRIVECKVDEAKITADLQEYSAQAREEGGEATVTDRMMQVAKKMLGIPYRFGGSSTRGIDCSAYVQKVFRFLNLPLPRTAREQYAVGREVSKGDLATGDLVFFRTYAHYPSHVGIYLGDSKFIHASSMGKKVTIDSLDTPFYNKRYIGAKRLVAEEEAQEADTALTEGSAG